MAKMLRDGIGTEADPEQAEQCFRMAFYGFQSLERDSHDDKLQYRLGQMLHTGTGTEQDDDAAARYWEEAAKLKNSNAQYALGKLWLENGTGDSEQAISYLEQSAEQGNQYAQYMLGKLYLCGRDVPRDKEKAISYLQASAAQGNIYAQFFLDHLDSFRDPSVFLCATNLMRHLSNLIREDTAYKNAGGIRYQMDQKRRRKLLEKRRAQGQKGHIMETQQAPYQ